MIKVTVTIPVYNGEATIRRCLKSVCAQTLKDIEIIVVNDGSTDNTLKEIDSIGDSRVKVITVKNGGQGLARNVGIDLAKGEYLAFVDADDTIEKDMLEVMCDIADKSGTDMVECNMLDIFPDGTSRVQLELNDEVIEITDRAEYTDRYFTPCYHSYEVCNKLIRKSAVGNLRFRDTRKYYSEDLLFNLELIERINKIAFTNKPFYNYYQNDSGHLHKDYEKRLYGLRSLFSDYIKSAPEDMQGAAAYTAAMVLSYSAGDCSESAAAKEMFNDDEYCGYILRALERQCSMSHRFLLTALSLAPVNLKSLLCRKYAERWKTD